MEGNTYIFSTKLCHTRHDFETQKIVVNYIKYSKNVKSQKKHRYFNG